MTTIPYYPQSVEINLDLRTLLHPLFQKLPEGISELTFANIYLFQKVHNYEISRLENQDSGTGKELMVIAGSDEEKKFFMLPFGIPSKDVLARLFQNHHTLKCVSQLQKDIFLNNGYTIFEDRDNYDYIYQRENLAALTGRKYHKKRNLIRAFINNHAYEGRPLLEEYIPQALDILENWRLNRRDDGDYYPAKEALKKCEALQLCGGIYYVEKQPVAYSLGEELACGSSFAIHFEKAVPGYKGLWQFVNQAFASIITEHYDTINREQDLGDEGLRKAKLSYQPSGFVKKYRVITKSDSNGSGEVLILS